MKLVAHLDADCFYVSAERVRDAYLLDKPVGVLGNQGACVIAKSYEMKALGVKTGEPIWDAVLKCPEGLYIKRDFRWYEVVSREMHRLVCGASPIVEYYSIDEFFLGVDAADPQRFASELQKQILDAVRVPVTIGVARTRTLAKLVSDLAKPFGCLALIGAAAEEELLAKRPAEDITGIGSRRAKTLLSYGIVKCLDFARAKPTLIRKLLTVVGEKLGHELRGVKCFGIQTSRAPHKVVSRGGSIGQATSDLAVQWAWVVRNLERLIEALDDLKLRPGKLALQLQFQHGPCTGAAARLCAPTTRFDLLVEIAQEFWPVVSLDGASLSRMHWFASELQRGGDVQLGLFDPPSAKDERFKLLMRAIRERHGRFSLRSAATLPLADIYADASHGYEVCDILGKTCF